ncbi:hypothetical protein Hdeb2414_s0021g00577241 [Helianthus debilis subsp. tardiflorus]
MYSRYLLVPFIFFVCNQTQNTQVEQEPYLLHLCHQPSYTHLHISLPLLLYKVTEYKQTYPSIHHQPPSFLSRLLLTNNTHNQTATSSPSRPAGADNRSRNRRPASSPVADDTHHLSCSDRRSAQGADKPAFLSGQARPPPPLDGQNEPPPPSSGGGERRLAKNQRREKGRQR